MDLSAGLVFWTVVGARVLVPIGVFRFPLPAMLASLVIDGLDQTIFQAFGIDLEGYQSYDKALDVYYLSMAYLAMMRNWVNPDAFRRWTLPVLLPAGGRNALRADPDPRAAAR